MPTAIPSAPFDTARLDRLMEAAGLDVVLATSRHNTRYLMGGRRSFFFATMEAIGHSRYLPVVLYPRGAPDRAAYVGSTMENWDHARAPFWTPAFRPVTHTTTAAAEAAVVHLRCIAASGRIGIEPAFLPADAHAILATALGADRLADATHVLENLRALKTPAELDRLRRASELIAEAMAATMRAARPGITKHALAESLRREETMRGLEFDYCLITFGTDLDRAPSDATLRPGDTISLDSGGNLDGWIGDICRMGILGEPDSELEDLLAAVEAVQQAAFAAIRPGTPGGAVVEAGRSALSAGPLAACADFVAHGMGLVSHEVPFIARHAMYEPTDADRPLEAGMVLSVETTAKHPRRGFVKLEDTVAVTPGSHELFAAASRGWIRAGTG
jgi:Xaa-Pro aminopeptidase